MIGDGALVLVGYCLTAGTWFALQAFRLRNRSPRLIRWGEWADESGVTWAVVEVRPRLFGWRP